MSAKTYAVLDPPDAPKSSAGSDRRSDGCCLETRARPRERIIAVARSMFHRHGLRNVSVEAIAEAAGTNKMTLYRHFGSKDELIVECLRAFADEMLVEWQSLEVRYPGDPRGQLFDWVRRAAECVLADRHGCALANAALELTETDHPARCLIDRCKTEYRERLVDLCRRAGIVQADHLADALSLLLEGARVSRRSVGAEGPSARFVRTSEAMINAFANG